jgi:hypothetical protein
VLLVRHSDTHRPERSYVLDVVLGEFLGLEWQAETRGPGPVEIVAAAHPDGPRVLVADTLFSIPSENWLTERALPRTPAPRWDTGGQPLGAALAHPELPVLYGRELSNGRFLDEHPEQIEFGIDLFGGIFFMLTRLEELVRPDRDEHDRFPAAESLAARAGFLHRPVVDEYAELLRRAIQRLWPSLPQRRQSFALRLSHDVDWPTHPQTSWGASVRQAGGDLIVRRDPGLATGRAAALMARRRRSPNRDPYNSFGFIMDRSEAHGLRSAFYFIPGTTDSRFDPGYTLDDPWVRSLLAQTHARGHEVGLHPSYGTYRSPDVIAAEFEALLNACKGLDIRQDSWGGRQHFLRWSNPVTWRAWDDAGLAYDSTLGYGQDPGFRCGTSHEFPVFDLVRRCTMSLRERPLIAMDMAILGERRGSRDGELRLLGTLANHCRMFGGQMTLLWHNSQLASSWQRRLYDSALEACLS